MRTRPCLLAWLVFAVALGAGCRPTLDDRPWLITKLQVVTWKADPPEASPGSDVSLQVVAIDPSAGGSPDTTATSWSLCHEPKPLDENRVASSGCLVPTFVDALGDPVHIAIPIDACRVFGPDTPQPAPGAPPTRPRDPDATGGYYQPVTVALGSSLAVGLERVTCDLPDASLAAARAFQAAYHPNRNPTISGLTFTVGGDAIDPGAVPLGAQVTVEAVWLSGASEPFPLFDRRSGAVLDAQETLVASWYVTGGELDQPATEIADPTVLSAVTGWAAPLVPTKLDVVFILRDSRGGSDVARTVVVVGGDKP